MIKLIKTISQFGVSPNYPRWKNRGIIITNNVAITCTILVLTILVLHEVIHQNDDVLGPGIFLAMVFVAIPYVNKLGKIDASRTLLNLTLIWGMLAMTIIRKMTSVDVVSVSTFYQSRAALVFFSVIPFATIHFSERQLLRLNIAIGFWALVLYDPIHNMMGVGFYQLGNVDRDYYYANIMYLFIYFVLLGAITFFKKMIDQYEIENETLISSLRAKTTLVESQKEELESQGEVLRQVLQEKDKDLSKVTEELIKFNHELLQYSYTISHNLRGPVATILGLLNLIKIEGEAKPDVLSHILASTKDLDGIIRDLNKIIEARSDTYFIREKVDFKELVDQVVQHLSIPINNYGLVISGAFGVSEFFTAKARLNHILVSLISNSIQYRRDGKPLEMKIRTYRQQEEIVLEVHDNGRGMDLNSYGENLFKPFTRFHTDASGKGIGLYLVKLQVERLHGRIEVQSMPDVGTTFLFYLKDWRDEKLSVGEGLPEKDSANDL